MEEILLVDTTDKPMGYLEKIAAHSNGGTLHRAFSIFIYNEKGEMLLQKRADSKYHFPGLWTNTCCGHQSKKDKSIFDAANRRLYEEFGFKADLIKSFEFMYMAYSITGLSEFEYDHVFVGLFSDKPKPTPVEISDFKWVGLVELKRDIEQNPDAYTPWFKIAFGEKNGILMDYQKLFEK